MEQVGLGSATPAQVIPLERPRWEKPLDRTSRVACVTHPLRSPASQGGWWIPTSNHGTLSALVVPETPPRMRPLRCAPVALLWLALLVGSTANAAPARVAYALIIANNTRS